MITVKGSFQKTFLFPARIHTAFQYYSDIQQSLRYLKHISILRKISDLEFRMLYQTLELGLYRVNLICDIQTELDESGGVLRILPTRTTDPIKGRSSITSLTSRGDYSSESIFKEKEEYTEVNYRMELCAQLPVPHGLKYMPKSILNSIAENISQQRFHEIAQGFIDNSILSFNRHGADQSH